MSRLHRLGSATPGEPIPLEGEAVTVGRGVENTIVLAGPRVSRHHCTFHRMPGGGFRLVDAGSRNGTRVNGEMIAQKILRPGDRIDIGGHEFSFGTGAIARPIVTRAAPAAEYAVPREDRPLPAPRLPKRRGGVAVTIASVAALVLVGAVVALLLLGGEPPSSTNAPRSPVAAAPAPAEAAPPPADPAPRAPAEPFAKAPAPEAGASSARLLAKAERAPAGEEVAAAAGGTDADSESAESARPAPTPEEVRASLARAGELTLAFRFAEAASALDAIEAAAPGGEEGDAIEGEIEAARAAAGALLAAHDRLVAKLGNAAALRAARNVPRVPGLGAVRGATPGALLAGSGEVAWKDVDPALYAALVRATEPGAESLLGLAYYGFARGLEAEAHRALADALALEPGLRGEATRLVSRVLGDEAPEGGFVFHDGRFMTPASRDAIVAEGRVKRLFEAVRGDDPALAAAAAAELGAPGSPHRERLEALLYDGIRIAQEAVQRDPLTKRLSALAEEKREIESLRAKALELVFDEERYPMPYEGKGVPNATTALKEKTQREIDKHVGALRKAWYEADEKAVTLTADFRTRAARLGAACSLFDAAGLAAPKLPDDAAFAAFLPEGEKKVTARTLFASASELRDHEHNVRTLRENEAVASSMTLVERELLRITNEYRILLGRRAVAHDERLLLAARAHCQEMHRCGYFGHSGATPETATLDLRLKAQGFDGIRMGENIAMTESPQGAHDLWYRSCGHHRNILNAAWTHLGSGNAGRLYTQNFARVE